MVMINIMINTSITSINGVVLMSIIGSPSPPPSEPTFIPMLCLRNTLRGDRSRPRMDLSWWSGP